MIKLILIQFIFTIFIEISRNFLVKKNKNNMAVLVLITSIIILIELDYREIIMVLNYREKLFKYVCTTIIPTIISNILYTYLAIKGFYKFTLIYRILGKLVIILRPEILELDWFILGSYRIISVAIIFFVTKYKFLNKRVDLRRKRKNLLEKIGCFTTIGFSVLLVLFMLGIFKFQAISIMSNSMFPLYKRGDVVIFEKTKNLEKIPKGKILIYNNGKKNIAHRIVETVKKNGKIEYQTKGDNNKNSDKDLVKTDQILGVYTFHIKYIGYPSIWLYEYFNYK